MRALLIYNPNSGGGGHANRLSLLAQQARQAGHTLEIVTPSTADAAADAARQGVAAGFARICAAGGDGTINTIIGALADSGVPLGIIPMGTVNVMAREFDISLEPERALAVALAGRVRRVDLGTVNGRPFLLMAGLGFDAHVVANAAPHLHDAPFRPLAYITAGLQLLTDHQPSRFRLQLDHVDLTLPAWMLMVSNAPSYAYQLPMAPAARMDDGLLDITVFTEESGLDRLLQIGAVFMGQHTQHPQVSTFRTHALQVTADPPAHLQVDGDAAGFTPATFAVRSGALHVVTP